MIILRENYYSKNVAEYLIGKGYSPKVANTAQQYRQDWKVQIDQIREQFKDQPKIANMLIKNAREAMKSDVDSVLKADLMVQQGVKNMNSKLDNVDKIVDKQAKATFKIPKPPMQ